MAEITPTNDVVVNENENDANYNKTNATTTQTNKSNNNMDPTNNIGKVDKPSIDTSNKNYPKTKTGPSTDTG